jgi:hypothetical protein
VTIARTDSRGRVVEHAGRKADDNVITEADVPAYSFTTSRLDDGAMMAAMVLVLRASTGAALCELAGNGEPGGPA